MPSVRRFAAWLVLSCLFAGQGVALAEFSDAARHPALVDDTACLGPSAGATGAHHADGVQFESPLPSQPLEHCAFCHLQRAFGSARPGSLSSSVLAPLCAAVIPEAAVALASAVRPAFAPRGPPASL